MSKLLARFGFVLTSGLALAACSSAPSGPAPETSSQAITLPALNKNLRIAVVGAGPSGLTAADTLTQNGFKNVTVFEKNDRVGGKVYSVPNGSGGYTELGAVFASSNYTLVLGLAQKYGIPYVAYPTPQDIVTPGSSSTPPQSLTPQAWMTANYSTLDILAAVAAYAPLEVEMNTVLAEDGFAIVPALSSDYYLPFVDFAKKRGITPITELVRAVMIGFGYGYYETTPAIYYLKLLGWLVQINTNINPSSGPTALQQPLVQPTYYVFPGGYQSIWSEVASGLNVQLNSTVTSIARPSPDGSPVQITINGTQTYDFDDVVISAPLNRVGGFMTLTSQESALFSQVQSETYDVSVFAAAGLPTDQASFFYGNANPSGLNHAVAWGNNGGTSSTGFYPYESWQIVDPSAPVGTALSTLQADVTANGGTFGQLVLQQDWDYFAHVNTRALQNGFYYSVAALQGRNHTFYVGGTLSFETVEHSARFAKTLVNTYFPAL
jgi:oxygen-dependent protoporphyrinogen oxidase